MTIHHQRNNSVIKPVRFVWLQKTTWFTRTNTAMEAKNIFADMEGSSKNLRLLEFFHNKKLVDCTFRINGVEVRAHKLMLAICSPVFERMFFWEIPTEEIILPDINLEDFNKVLEFIYTDRIPISSVAEAWTLFSIADKYIIKDLEDICLHHIKNNITMSDLVLSYEYADMYNLEDIKASCFKDIRNYLSGVFAAEYHMKPSTLHELLKHKLNITNTELLLKIIDWAVDECAYQKRQLVPVQIVDILREGDLLKFINKNWLIDIFCNVHPHYKLDAMDEIVQGTLTYLDEVLEWKEEADCVEHCFMDRSQIRKYRTLYKIARRIYHPLQDLEFVSQVSVNKRTMLLGVAVSTEHLSSSELYQGTVVLRICEENKNLVKPTTSVFDVYSSNTEYWIMLQDVVILEVDKIYEIRISYKNINSQTDSSIVCYYMSNELNFEEKDCRVYFYDTFGSVFRGLIFYPA